MRSVARAVKRSRADAAPAQGGLSVRSQGGPHALSAARVRTMAVRMLREAGRAGAELSVLLVDDGGIREMNRTWRGQDRATDVLSFPMQEGEFGTVNPTLLGDVVISVPTAERQAREAGRALADEVAVLLAHGLLHLLGFDHDTSARDKVMRRETERLVAAWAAGR